MYSASRNPVATEVENFQFLSSSFKSLMIVQKYMYFSLFYPYKVTVCENNKLVFTSGYLRMVIPISIDHFKFIFKNQTFTFDYKTVFFKATWAILQLLYIIIARFSMLVRITLKKKISDDPTQLYIVVGDFVWFIATLVWPYLIIFKHQFIVNLFKYCHTLNGLNSSSNSKKVFTIQIPKHLPEQK